MCRLLGCHAAYSGSSPSGIGPRRTQISSNAGGRLKTTRGDSLFRQVVECFVVVLGVCPTVLCYICLARRMAEIIQPVIPSGVSWLTRLKLMVLGAVNAASDVSFFATSPVPHLIFSVTKGLECCIDAEKQRKCKKGSRFKLVQ